MWIVYPLWLGVCLLLFVAMRDWPDPSRPSGRIINDEAARAAEKILQMLDGGKYADYEVVNVSFARGGEAGKEPRWLVLCDEDERTQLKRAIVIELRSTDGRFIRARRLPGHNVPTEAFHE